MHACRRYLRNFGKACLIMQTDSLEPHGIHDWLNGATWDWLHNVTARCRVFSHAWASRGIISIYEALPEPDVGVMWGGE